MNQAPDSARPAGSAPSVRSISTQDRARPRPHRILLVVNDLPFFLSHRLPLAVGAANAGFEVHVATPDHPRRDELVDAGIPFHPFPLSRSGVGVTAELASLRALYRLYRELKPDLVHHVTIKPVLYGSMAARLARVPAVVNAISGLGHVFTASGIGANVRRGLVRLLYRAALRRPATSVIFQNQDDASLFVDSGAVRPEQVVLIPGSGVDLDRFRPSPEPEGPPVVVLAARMLWDKGVGDFVAAARLLRGRGVECRLVLVGESDPGNPRTVPDSQLAAWAAEGVVEWWGRRDDMPAVFASCHVCCLPSRYREGVPKVLLEAAAAGRAIVTTDTPGCRDTVLPGESGLVVPAGDVAALADAFQSLISSPERRTSFGRQARRLAEAKFSIGDVVRSTLAVYQQLLGRNG